MYVIRFECPPFGNFFERFKVTALRQKEFHVFLHNLSFAKTTRLSCGLMHAKSGQT